MEGVEIGNEIWVWAGRILSTDFTDDTDSNCSSRKGAKPQRKSLDRINRIQRTGFRIQGLGLRFAQELGEN
jgi:hypothetical protein